MKTNVKRGGTAAVTEEEEGGGGAFTSQRHQRPENVCTPTPPATVWNAVAASSIMRPHSWLPGPSPFPNCTYEKKRFWSHLRGASTLGQETCLQRWCTDKAQLDHKRRSSELLAVTTQQGKVSIGDTKARGEAPTARLKRCLLEQRDRSSSPSFTKQCRARWRLGKHQNDQLLDRSSKVRDSSSRRNKDIKDETTSGWAKLTVAAGK